MRTTLEVDRGLLAEVVRLTGAKSKGKALSIALREFVRRASIERLRQLPGKIILEENWQGLREMELHE